MKTIKKSIDFVKKERKLKKLVDEEWKEIPYSDGKYFISNYGRVKSFFYNKPDGQILKPYTLKGFNAVGLTRTTHSRYVHKLVAITWLDQPTEGQTIVIHNDGNIRNNYYKNLRWATQEEVYKRHSEQMVERGKRLSKKELITASKLKENDVRHIKTMLRKGITQHVIAKLFKVSEMQITRIKRGENWPYVEPFPEEN
jgi:hypothetical protein